MWRFRGNCKSTTRCRHVPMTIDKDIFAGLRGERHFRGIDLKQAYPQMELHDDSKPLMTVNTPQVYTATNYYRLVSHLRAIDQVLQGIPKTKCYLNDIIVTGSTLEEHLANLDTVFQRLQDYGFRVNQSSLQILPRLSGILWTLHLSDRSDRKVRDKTISS